MFSLIVAGLTTFLGGALTTGFSTFFSSTGAGVAF